jgi:tyrosine decarboxylase/aspartate 1-decarboxylase
VPIRTRLLLLLLKNIVAINADFVAYKTATRFDLVPKKHDPSNRWYKVVVMDHVEIERLMQFTDALNKNIPHSDKLLYF